MPIVNRVMVAWLRSRWHRPVSGAMMVLTYEGASSGRTYTFPVGYAADADGLVTFTRFSWRQNFRRERSVLLSLRGREVRGVAVAVKEPEAVADRFAYYLRSNPHDARYFGVKASRNGRINSGDMSLAAGCLTMIRTVLADEHTP